LKVLEVSDSHLHGGAGIASNRIFSSLQKTDLEILRVTSDTEKYISLFPGRKFLLMQNILSYFNLDKIIKVLFAKEIVNQFENIIQSNTPDVIHFHNIHSAHWPIDIVKKGLDYCNVAWTMHDCWSFLTSYYPNMPTTDSTNKELRKSLFWKSVQGKKNNLVGITPSEWMKKTAKSSHWSTQRIETVHNPVPDFFFNETDRLSIKKALGLKLDIPAVLCIAANLSEERKGGRLLLDLINNKLLEKTQIILCGNVELSEPYIHPNLYRLGFLQDDLTLKMVYSAADFLIHPATIDNLPNTVAESLCSGTPVLAFRTGGIPEMIREKQSGWLVERADNNAFKLRLNTIISDKSYLSLRESSRKLARKLFDENSISNKYHEILKSLSP